MADPNLRLIADLYHAILRGYTNEVALDQKSVDGHPTFDDPLKLRFGAWPPADGRSGFYLGAIGADLLSGDPTNPTRHEKGFLALKLDPVPTIEIFLQRRADTTEDRDMIRVVTITASGVEWHVPVKGFSAPTGQAFLSSPNGKFVTHQQDDGNLVTYEVTPDGWVPVWSSWTGRLG